MRVVMYLDLVHTLKGVMGCQVVQLFEDIKIYTKNIMERYKLIRNKGQIGRNVPEKPEKSSPEIVDGKANHGESKITADTVHTELAKDKPTSKFEEAAFAKYVQLRNGGVTRSQPWIRLERRWLS